MYKHKEDDAYYQEEKLWEAVDELLKHGYLPNGLTLFAEVDVFGHYVEGLDQELALLLPDWDSDGDCKILRVLVALRNGKTQEASELAMPLIEKIEQFVEDAIKNQPAEDF